MHGSFEDNQSRSSIGVGPGASSRHLLMDSLNAANFLKKKKKN